MFTGFAHDPVGPDNCAVYVLPVNDPALLNGTETAEPEVVVEQNGEPLIAPVLRVADTFMITSLLVISSHGNDEMQII